MPSIIIRPIRPDDNIALARIIREALAEFGANKPGTVYYDPTTDALFELFGHPGSSYLVAELDGTLVGGGGIFPSPGLPEGTCELVKMYLAPAARGIGLGKTLLDRNLAAARQAGYRSVYLESMPELRQALRVYEKSGFRYLPGPLGNTGHFGCGIWMLRDLEAAG
ncbi:MAG TPA: GNAT family N-acetyltransferase [Chitinophagaceae bacterium]|nr:GNAT family N-acetyltransferase [Chitinophagaceae bacterium]